MTCSTSRHHCADADSSHLTSDLTTLLTIFLYKTHLAIRERKVIMLFPPRTSIDDCDCDWRRDCARSDSLVSPTAMTTDGV